MSKTHLFEQVAAKKIIPVVKLDRVSDAKPLGEALCKGGLPVAEVASVPRPPKNPSAL